MQKTTNLMLVDDEQHVIDYVSELVKDMGIRVSGFALNGEEALEKLPEANPDMILMDVTMPGMPGDELVAEVKKVNQDIVIAMLTSRHTVKVVQSCIKKGAAGYILKSQGPDYIVKKISELVSTIPNQ